MRVALKIVAVFVLLVIMLLAVEAVLRTRREAEIYDQDLRRDQRVLGRALREIAELTWREQSYEAAERILLVTADSEREVTIRLLEDEAVQTELEALLESAEKGSDAGGAPDLVQASQPGAIITIVPVLGPDERRLALELATSRTPERERLARSMRSFVVIAAMLTVICGILAIVAGRVLIGKRIAVLVEQSQALAAGRFVRSELAQNDELGELGRALDQTSEQLAAAKSALEQETRERERATEQLRWADRLATAGTLAAGLAHELGTPLHVVAGRARRIVHDAEAAESSRTDAGIIVEQAGQMQEIVRELLDFARPPRRERKTIDLLALVTRTSIMLEPLLNRRRVRLELERGDRVEQAWTHGNPDQLQQVLTNLLVNAAQAMSEGGRIGVHVVAGLRPAQPHEREREYVRIRVSDEGPGIAPDIVEQIFDPFFTTKQLGEGTGLGLSIAYGIVRDHGGWILVHPVEPHGAAFELWLPQIDQHASEESET